MTAPYPQYAACIDCQTPMYAPKRTGRCSDCQHKKNMQQVFGSPEREQVSLGEFA